MQSHYLLLTQPTSASSRLSDERWEARIERARHLARERPAAAEALSFYASLAALQQSFLQRHSDPVEAVSELLTWLRREAPEALARAAGEMNEDPRDAWRGRLEGRLSGERHAVDSETPRAFVVDAVLQPFAEAGALALTPPPPLRGYGEARLPPLDANRCPTCASGPVVGTLREEGHGTKRSFVCALCFAEWRAPRLGCVACGEERFEALPVFRSGELDPARVDACDTCRTYLKTIDLTRDGTAVPIVDDLASLALDLWAREQGYQRLRPNLLRL